MDISVNITTTHSGSTDDAALAVRRALDESSTHVLQRAIELVPVDTGELRSSIRVEPITDGFAITAGEGLPDARARFQEYGFHHYITQQFIQNAFLRPALEENRTVIIAAIARALINSA
jgi:hypothetical protein